MTENSVPKNSCPYCGAEFDRATSFEHSHPPVPGDVSVCISCARILVYNDRLLSIPPTLADMEIITRSPNYKSILKLIAAIHYKKFLTTISN